MPQRAAGLAPFYLANLTASVTACLMDVNVFKPAAVNISLACFSLVPVRRITRGTGIFICLIAIKMPLAISSQRVMPPKILMRMTLMSLLRKIMFNALNTFWGLEERLVRRWKPGCWASQTWARRQPPKQHLCDLQIIPRTPEWTRAISGDRRSSMCGIANGS